MMRHMRLLKESGAITLLLACSVHQSTAESAKVWKLDCFDGPLQRGHQHLAGSRYRSTDGSRAFGFDLTTPPQVKDKACTGDSPFFVSVAEPEGNYRVTVLLGKNDGAAVTTVKAEGRRLMLEQLAVASGQSLKRSFVVNLRTPYIESENSVLLKPREIGALDWDEKLTLEFTGTHPSVRSIAIEPIRVPTVYLAGDSTVVDQTTEPWAAWGQMLPAFFSDKVAIANHAESGETIQSFVKEKRFDKIMSMIGCGEYLFLQFAHNDQKAGPGLVSIPEYQSMLRRYVAKARDRGAWPVLVTSMNRRKFSPDGSIVPTLGGYPEAMRQVAREENVPLIDLNALSKTLFESLGPDGTQRAFVHYPANTFPDQPEELKDDTHFNAYGALELAKCVADSISNLRLPLAKYLHRDASHFDPAHPDPIASWTVPPDPYTAARTP